MLHVDVPHDCTTTGAPSAPLANYLRRRGATYSVRVRVPKASGRRAMLGGLVVSADLYALRAGKRDDGARFAVVVGSC